MLSHRHPWLYSLSVRFHRWRRRLSSLIDGRSYCNSCIPDVRLPNLIYQHRSLLLRSLEGVEGKLQRNKVVNLAIVCRSLDGVMIRPGETFSFCQLVGCPTQRRGFREGLELSFGKPRSGIGGGICQSTNLIYWLALHSELEVTERHHHTCDPFPDQGRVLPWSTGAAVFFNYRDLQLTNNSSRTYQIRIYLDETYLNCELRVDVTPPLSYHISQQQHRFLRYENDYYRANEIWQRHVDRRNGNTITNILVSKNIGRVLYEPTQEIQKSAVVISKKPA